MPKKLSKFEYLSFYGGYDDFAVSSQRYTEEEALEIFKREMGPFDPGTQIGISKAFVTHRAGINEDLEPVVGWWMEYRKGKRQCPVHVFHVVQKWHDDDEWGYKLITIENKKVVEGEKNG